LQRNNCFTDVERDSILNKLLAKEYFEIQFKKSQEALYKADIIINELKEKDSITLIIHELEIDRYEEINKWQGKEKTNSTIKAGLFGILAGFVVAALII